MSETRLTIIVPGMTLIGSRKRRIPGFHFWHRKQGREKLLPKALGKKLHATFLPSPPSHSYWKSSSSDNTEVRMLFTVSVVNEVLLQLR